MSSYRNYLDLDTENRNRPGRVNSFLTQQNKDDRALVPLRGRPNRTHTTESNALSNRRNSPQPVVIRRRSNLSSSPSGRSRSTSPISPSPVKGVSTILGPDSNQDTTVHLELEVEEDLESELEEFSRLKRLGHFKAAEQHFQNTLRDYIEAPPLAVEYADMLLQQGAYKRLRELLETKELKAPTTLPLRPWSKTSPGLGRQMRTTSPPSLSRNIQGRTRGRSRTPPPPVEFYRERNTSRERRARSPELPRWSRERIKEDDEAEVLFRRKRQRDPERDIRRDVLRDDFRRAESGPFIFRERRPRSQSPVRNDFRQARGKLTQQGLPSSPPPVDRVRTRVVERVIERERERSPTPPPKRSQSRSPPDTYSVSRGYQGGKIIESDKEKFDLAFRLIENCLEVYSLGWLRSGLTAARDAQTEFQDHRIRQSKTDQYYLSSTDVQIINLWSEIMAKVRILSSSAETDVNLPDTNSYMPSSDAMWSHWDASSEYLKDEGRIWELKDVISTAMSLDGAEGIWLNLFKQDVHAADFLENILDDWTVNIEYDPSTYLAILSILVELAKHFAYQRSSPGDFTVVTAKRCLEHGRMFATCIKENNPQNIKSRPYLMWIIVQKRMERKMQYFSQGLAERKPAFERAYFASLSGLSIWRANPLPLFIPKQSENPGWPISESYAMANELLHNVLQASREMGDYKTEVACLQEMICRSSQPRQLYERLAHVQNALQGDMAGCLHTLLSKYLLVTTKEDRQNLVDELAVFDSYDIRDPVAIWCQQMIKAALYRSLGEHAFETQRAQQMARDVAQYLPDDLWYLAKRRGFLMSREVDDEFSKRPREDVQREQEIKREVVYGENKQRPVRYNSQRVNQDLELEQARKEIEKVRKEEQEREKLANKERERELVERHLMEEELKKKKKTEEEMMFIQKYKMEEAAKKAKKALEEQQYQTRFRDDLFKSGLDSQEVARILEKAKHPALPRPTWTRMSRRHLSLEALNKFKIDYELDADPDYVLLKRWVPEHEQDLLWAKTTEIRAARGSAETIVNSEVDHRPSEPRRVISRAEAEERERESEFEFAPKRERSDPPRPSPPPPNSEQESPVTSNEIPEPETQVPDGGEKQPADDQESEAGSSKEKEEKATTENEDEDPMTFKIKKRPTFAHVESVEDDADASPQAGIHVIVTEEID